MMARHNNRNFRIALNYTNFQKKLKLAEGDSKHTPNNLPKGPEVIMAQVIYRCM